MRCALLAALLVLGASPSAAQPAVRHVLVLQSFDRGHLPLDVVTGNFRVDVEQGVGGPVNFVQVVVGPTGFVRAPEQAVLQYIRSMFADGRRPDLIMTVGGPAAVFARKHRPALFPEAPLLLAAVDQRHLRAAPLGRHETAVAVENDFSAFVDDILQVLPQTRQLFVIIGSGQLGSFFRRELETEFDRFHDRLTLTWSDDLSFHEILRQCARLPPNSAIFYVVLGSDAQGGTYPDERALAELHETANAPIFGLHSVMLGSGVVGGKLMSIERLSRNTGDAAIRILSGERPESLQVPTQLPGPPIFDWRELQRWGIAESRLPPGSTVLHRHPSLWQEHKRTVVGGMAALVVQSLLIVGLLYQRRARHRAEMDSRRNLALAADASRRQTLSALTASIAHELGQPLSSMIHNAQALERMVIASHATPETMSEVVADIRTQGAQAMQIIERHRRMLRTRQLDRKPTDLHVVIRESLALVTHDMRARQVEVTLDLSSRGSIISGDQVLLEQVLVNLMVNAMDAMAEMPPARRSIEIRTEARAAEIVLSVSDTGTGLPAHFDAKLFAPFVTTKATGIGIGLTIARTIVEAHDGTLEAHNNHKGGATFVITLRRSEMPVLLRDQAGAA